MQDPQAKVKQHLYIKDAIKIQIIDGLMKTGIQRWHRQAKLCRDQVGRRLPEVIPHSVALGYENGKSDSHWWLKGNGDGVP